MANLMITGGAGFIGTNFVHHWHRQRPDDRLLVLDRLTYAGNLDGIRPLIDDENVCFVRGDILDTALVRDLLTQYEIDVIVHFAAETHVDRSIEGPETYVKTNVNGTNSLLMAAQSIWLSGSGRPHRFHHISTDEVYGALATRDAAPFTEQTAYAPNSPYSASKAAADFLVRAFHRTYGLETTVSYSSNNYGPFQFPEKLIPLMITHALQGRRLPVYGDGSNVRDWIHVSDHCAGITAVLERGTPGETYNIGSNAEYTNLEVVSRICELLESRFQEEPVLRSRFAAARGRGTDGPFSGRITFVPDRAGHDYRYALDATRTRQALGFGPKVHFAAGLSATVDWYLQHADWWESVANGDYQRNMPPLQSSATL
jgi:dTDP-glucose 4,6-dehydratase